MGLLDKCHLKRSGEVGASLSPATSVRFLSRLKVARSGSLDWNRFEAIYVQLIRRWIGRIPGLGDDVDDLTQEVLLVLVRKIPRFERQREGSFRAWLRKVTANQLRTYWKRRRGRPIAGLDQTTGFLDRLADPHSDLADQWDREHDKHVLDTLMALVRPDFSQDTWDAFVRFALEGCPSHQVARELGISENAVIKAKYRVLCRLRQEASELVD